MDIIVVRYPDGTLKSTPIRARFGSLKIINAKEKTVSVIVNELKTNLSLKLSESGDVYIPKDLQKIHLIDELNQSDQFDDYEDLRASENYNISLRKLSNEQETKNKKISFDFSSNSDIKTTTGSQMNALQSNYLICQAECFTIYKATTRLEFELSRSWNLLKKDDNAEDTFYRYLISKEEFLKDPFGVLNDSNLAITFEEDIFNWKAISPLVVSLLAYETPLPSEIFTKLTTIEHGFLRNFLRSCKESNIVKLDEKKRNESYRKYSHGNTQPPKHLNTSKASNQLSPENIIRTCPDLIMSPIKLDPYKSPNTSKRRNFDIYYKHCYTLDSDQLKSLNLKNGRNSIIFEVYSRLQGTQKLSSSIYLWDLDSKIVVSDIDGTITRSDILGQVLPWFGKDWTHCSIVKFYRNISNNGYKIIYLSARAITQAKSTRKFLDGIRQNNFNMPEGPILLSPDGILTSLKREVIDKSPQNFKITSLIEVSNLFPEDFSPFYAGFGNKPTVKIFLYIGLIQL